MPCFSCVDKLAYKLMSHHKIDMIRAYELAERGVERVEKPLKTLPTDDPYDYVGDCASTGLCSCKAALTVCDPIEEDSCLNPVSTCACNCHAPPKTHSHLESNTCGVAYSHNCYCSPPTKKCLSGLCACICTGLCYYHCDDGYVWNPATLQCELPVVVATIQGDGLTFATG